MAKKKQQILTLEMRDEKIYTFILIQGHFGVVVVVVVEISTFWAKQM